MMLDYHSVYRVLLRCGADPNARDDRGNTVLMYHRKSPEAIKNLVEAGADINAANDAGETLMSMTLQEQLQHHRE